MLELQQLLDMFSGQIEPATIDFQNRKGRKNKDGSISTLLQNVVGVDDGKQLIIPTIVDGEELPIGQALKKAKETGQHGGLFKSLEDAESAARFRSFILGEIKNGR
jgi:hypothetical protein